MGDIRIIGGKWRGRKLQIDASSHVRPTSNRLRETVFNWLQFEIHQTVWLDLCCGSGALGLEALSRGADKVVFVDQHPEVIALLQKKCEQWQIDRCSCQCVCATWPELVVQTTIEERFHGIFLDPPFAEVDRFWQTFDQFNRWPTLRWLYLELPKSCQLNDLPGWQLQKHALVGQAQGCLWRRTLLFG